MKSIRAMKKMGMSIGLALLVFGGNAIASEGPMAERKAQFQERCAADPAKCEQAKERMKARHEKLKEKCAADPEKCQQMRERIQERREACKADLEGCKQRREQHREQRKESAS